MTIKNNKQILLNRSFSLMDEDISCYIMDNFFSEIDFDEVFHSNMETINTKELSFRIKIHGLYDNDKLKDKSLKDYLVTAAELIVESSNNKKNNLIIKIMDHVNLSDYQDLIFNSLDFKNEDVFSLYNTLDSVFDDFPDTVTSSGNNFAHYLAVHSSATKIYDLKEQGLDIFYLLDKRDKYNKKPSDYFNMSFVANNSNDIVKTLGAMKALGLDRIGCTQLSFLFNGLIKEALNNIYSGKQETNCKDAFVAGMNIFKGNEYCDTTKKNIAETFMSCMSNINISSYNNSNLNVTEKEKALISACLNIYDVLMDLCVNDNNELVKDIIKSFNLFDKAKNSIKENNEIIQHIERAIMKLNTTELKHLPFKI